MGCLGLERWKTSPEVSNMHDGPKTKAKETAYAEAGSTLRTALLLLVSELLGLHPLLGTAPGPLSSSQPSSVASS